jgi:hypothetical protein
MPEPTLLLPVNVLQRSDGESPRVSTGGVSSFDETDQPVFSGANSTHSCLGKPNPLMNDFCFSP